MRAFTCVWKHTDAWVCTLFFILTTSQLCNPEGNEQDKKMFGFTPLCESRWLEVGFTLVLDNCTLPRSVVPILVSLWPSEPARALFRLHVRLILSRLIPILSDKPPHHSRRQIKGQWAVERADVGVCKNCTESTGNISRSCSFVHSFCFLICSVDVKSNGLLHKRFLGTLCNQKYFQMCSSCVCVGGFILCFAARAPFPDGTAFRAAAVCLWNQSCDLNEAIFSWLCTRI